MSERGITKLSLLCSLTGLAALYGAASSSQPTVTSISSLNDDFVGTRVMISGKVVQLRPHADGHLFLKLQDESGATISVPLFARLRSKLREPIELLDVVQVTGEVKKYKDELEVIPERVEDLRVVHTPPAKLSSLSRDNLGQLVKVQAVVAEREVVGKGSLILILKEDGHELPLFVPVSVVRNGFPEVHVGNVVRVHGKLQLYRNKLELKLAHANHLRVIEA